MKYFIKRLKWLCIDVYKAPSQDDKYFIDSLSKNHDELTCQYNKTMLIGHFNLTTDDKNLEMFMNTYNQD